MSKWRKLLCFLLMFLICIEFSGCSKFEDYKVNIGLKNKDFEYINEGKVQKVVVQNVRDKGFRFEISNDKAIKDLYDILSTSKSVSSKTLLDPDYIFELYQGDTLLYKYYYVVGLDKKDSGNFYGQGKNYIVSNRLDDNLISSFWNVRRPKEFDKVYYESILTALDNCRKTAYKDGKMGIDIKNDVQSARFILSVDVDDFKNKIAKSNYNAEIITDNNVKYDLIMKVETQGFKNSLDLTTAVFKSIITVDSNKDSSEKKYYIYDNYSNGSWNIKVFADTSPAGF